MALLKTLKGGTWKTSSFGPQTTRFGFRKPPAGKYLLRIVAHKETDAVAVDVDGVTIN
jgi:hypothetical protein